MARLVDLKPEWRRIYRDRHLTADNGGTPTDDYELMFACPCCGPPCRIIIKVGATTDPAQPRWAVHPLPDGPGWPTRVTITPSIDYTKAGHGRKRAACTFHGNIIDGEVKLT